MFSSSRCCSFDCFTLLIDRTSSSSCPWYYDCCTMLTVLGTEKTTWSYAAVGMNAPVHKWYTPIFLYHHIYMQNFARSNNVKFYNKEWQQILTQFSSSSSCCCCWLLWFYLQLYCLYYIKVLAILEFFLTISVVDFLVACSLCWLGSF